MERIARGVALLAAAGVLAAADAGTAGAQEADSGGVLVGYVADQFGQPVEDAELLVLDSNGHPTARTARTAAAGVYRLEAIPSGVHQVRIRRPGYMATSQPVRMTAGSTRMQDWELRRLPVNVDPQAVQEPNGEMRLGMQAFYQRRQAGLGTFIDRAMIEQRRPRYVRELLRGVSGFRLATAGPSGDVVVVSTGTTSCRAKIYVEGLPYTPLTGIDDFAPEDIQAIEAYAAGSPVAAELNAGDAECGALVIWLRR